MAPLPATTRQRTAGGAVPHPLPRGALGRPRVPTWDALWGKIGTQFFAQPSQSLPLFALSAFQGKARHNCSLAPGGGWGSSVGSPPSFPRLLFYLGIFFGTRPQPSTSSTRPSGALLKASRCSDRLMFRGLNISLTVRASFPAGGTLRHSFFCGRPQLRGTLVLGARVPPSRRGTARPVLLSTAHSPLYPKAGLWTVERASPR